MHKSTKILLNAVPVLIMLALIPIVDHDYFLTLLYVITIFISLKVKKEKHDITILLFGFFIMLICESLFIQTGVETFNRNSLFGIMPLWLPFLWGYGFVAIKRSVDVLNS